MMAALKHYIQAALKISFVFNIVLSIVLGVLFAVWGKPNFDALFNTTTYSGNSSSLVTDENRVCFRCDDLGKDVKANETLYNEIVVTDCQKRMCCVRDNVIRDFIKATYNNKEGGRADEGTPLWNSFSWWRNRTSAAHLYLNRSHPLTDDGDMTLRWMKPNAEGFGTSFNNMRLINDTHFDIEENGNYFVYAVVSFNHDGSQEVKSFFMTLTKTDSRLSGKEELLISQFGGSLESDRHHVHFLSGIFQLYSKKRLSITLHQNGVNFLDKTSPVASFWGLFKL